MHMHSALYEMQKQKKLRMGKSSTFTFYDKSEGLSFKTKLEHQELERKLENFTIPKIARMLLFF